MTNACRFMNLSSLKIKLINYLPKLPMAESSSAKTLLALLLALNNLETPLNSQEQKRLYEVGEQLELDPDDWDFIEEGLMAIINNNPTFKVKFQEAFTKLNQIDEINALNWQDIITELRQPLIKNKEIEEKGIEKRGFEPGQSINIVSHTLINDVVVPILKAEDPQSTSQQLTPLQRFWNSLLEFGSQDNSPPSFPPQI